MIQDLVKSLNLGGGTVEWLRSLQDAGTLQCIRTNPPESDRRCLVWSDPTDARRTTAIVSSRLGRQLSRKDAFFRVLRIACSQLDPQKQVLLSASGTATHPYVVRAAELFGLDVRQLVFASDGQELGSWLLELASLIRQAHGEREHHATTGKIFVSPPLDLTLGSRSLRDELVVQQADQVLAMHVRSQGSIECWLQRRLESSTGGRVFLALGASDLISPAVAEPLMANGAVGWYLPPDNTEASVPTLRATAPNPAAILALSDLPDAARYLSHCTRSSDGPWPDQSEQDFLDELIMGDVVRDRSAFATLRRIVTQRRILATGAAIRNKVPVVSLTGVPLSRLGQLRRYRSHRGRWDFEPYGIAVNRDSLTSRGARPVIYGDEATWRSLSADDQPFFQKVGDQENAIDWRVEQEWRLLRDLDLSSVAIDRAVLFVPTHEEAEHLANVSPWPVVVLGTETSAKMVRTQ